ncbi:MAG: hypothetical protein LBL58_01145 [Tannerellaceae bacterium]|jgi:hypothetical protein|nr:hypothetical protein [Tannerellaceae bacterium]
MKKLMLGSLLAGSIMLLNSCLDGENSSSIQGEYYGLVEIDLKAGGNVIYYNDEDYPLYSPTLSLQILDGECCRILCTYKSEDNPNTATVGYHIIQEIDYAVVDKGTVIPTKADTVGVKENELSMSTLVLRNYVKGYLFIDSYQESMDTGQENRYELSYNIEQEPVLESNKNVYQLYLRTSKVGDGKSPKNNQIVPNAYYVKYFFDTISNAEKEKGNSEYSFKINYIKSFTTDSTPNWASSEIQTIPITKNE